MKKDLQTLINHNNKINNSSDKNKVDINLLFFYEPYHNFDWQFYINYYNDLKKEGIDNENKAKEHWKKHGITENRFKSQYHYDLYNNYDWKEYYYNNLDLIDYNINNELIDKDILYNNVLNQKHITLKLIDHWIIYGTKQNRKLYEKDKFITILEFSNDIFTQMFQYSFLLNISIKNNIKIKIKNFDKNKINIFDIFNISHEKIDENELQNEFISINEQKFNYSLSLTYLQNKKQYINYNGYFMSYKYFQDINENILKIFGFKDNIKNEVKSYIDSLKMNNNNCKIIAITLNIKSGINNEFINNALEYIDNLNKSNENIIIIIYNDYTLIKDKLRIGRRIKYITPFNDDILNLCLLTLSDYLIISDTTLSWWGGYLNKNIDKKIFIENIDNNKEYFFNFIIKNKYRYDIIPNDWIQL